LNIFPGITRSTRKDEVNTGNYQTIANFRGASHVILQKNGTFSTFAIWILYRQFAALSS